MNDWDPGLSTDSNVYVLRQTFGDGQLLYDMDATGVHILYDKIYPYNLPNIKLNRTAFATFSVSIYEDGYSL